MKEGHAKMKTQTGVKQPQDKQMPKIAGRQSKGGKHKEGFFPSAFPENMALPIP